MGYCVGQQLGNYRLIRLLGQGSFAEVYQGEHVYLKTQAAIKVLHVHLSGKHEQDFLREAQTLAHLEHPHVVHILDFGVHEGSAFLVMQHAAHGSVRMTHPYATTLPLTTVLPYVKQVASALQYAHERKVIHRDVKPENMLLGQNHQLLLSDFGLAVVMQSLSQQQNVAGTLSYMAPEQLHGHPCAASDQYALGVVVYEWLCGTLPFNGTFLEVATQHLLTIPPALSAHNPAISPAVEQVVLMALAKEPAQRFVNIMAFATALEQAVLSETSHQEQTFYPGFGGRRQNHPLVGRAQERDSLRNLLRETEQWRQSTRDALAPTKLSPLMPTRTAAVFLLGDAGIGKTRLAEEMGQEAKQCGWSVAWGHSYAQENHLPYQIWIEVVRHIIELELWQPQQERLPTHLMQALTILLPEYSDLFLPGEEPPIAQSVGTEPPQIKEAICALLMLLSKHAPLFILLDDLYWADTSSVELFGYLARRLVAYPVLLIGTGRKSELPSEYALPMLLAHLQRERLIVQIQLAPLTDEQIAELVAPLPDALVTSIQRQVAGNPFFAEELARSCLVQQKDMGDARASSAHQESIPLPETIAFVLDQQLGKLSSSCLRLLGCVAVLGRAFSFSTLSSMYSGKHGAGDDEEILALLEEALEARLLLEEGARSNISYRFRHPLLMSRLYETLSVTRRTLFHRHAAAILRVEYVKREGEGAAIITYHLLHGGADPLEIAETAEQAGNHAYTLAAYAEAEQHYSLALAQRKEHQARTRETQDTQEEQVAFTEAHHHQTFLLEQLGECLRIQGRDEEARHCYEQALEMWSRWATTYELQQERQLLAMLCIKIGQTWEDISNIVQAQQCYELSEQILQEAGIVTGTAIAYLRLRQSYILWLQGSYEGAYLLAQEARALFEQALEQPLSDTGKTGIVQTHIQRTLQGEPVDLGRTYVLLALIDNGLGRYNNALDHLHYALAIFEQYRYQREIAITCCDLGDLYLRKADHAQAQSVLQRSLDIAEHVGDIPLVAVVLANQGMLHIRTGELKTAETILRRASLLIKSFNDPYIITMVYIYLAKALQEQGETIEASKMLRRAIRLARKYDTPVKGAALVALGRLWIEQALEMPPVQSTRRARLLMYARKIVQQALALPKLEAETRVEGLLVLTQVMFLEGAIEAAYEQALQTLIMACQLELLWLVAHVQCLLGNISAVCGLDVQADQYFMQAGQGFRTYGMRLAYGRVLQRYGQFLCKQEGSSSQRGHAYLQKAYKLFRVCGAKRDQRRLEQILADMSADTVAHIILKSRSSVVMAS